MPYQWNHTDWQRFDAAMDKLDFGKLDRVIVIENSLYNSVDVPEDEDPVGVAISTAEMYIDQGIESF